MNTFDVLIYAVIGGAVLRAAALWQRAQARHRDDEYVRHRRLMAEIRRHPSNYQGER